MAVIPATGLLIAPFALPLVPLDTFLKMAASAGGAMRVEHERHKTTTLPQHFADRFGWDNMAAQVVKVWRDLPPEDRGKACIFRLLKATRRSGKTDPAHPTSHW